MKLRQARKINRRNAESSHRLYRISTLKKALKRMRRQFALERRHACECGRQRYRPSDKNRPCTYEHCQTHRPESTRAAK